MKRCLEKECDFKNIDITTLKDRRVLNLSTTRMIDCHLKNNEVERKFNKNEPGYIATVGTDLGVGKWYLINHHFKNKEIVAVTLQRGIEKDENGTDIYNILYHIEDKR